jgi:CheY-like chemotaxis protein
LLAFARKSVSQPAPVDLAAQVMASEKILLRLVGEGARLVVDASQPVWPVMCDPGQLDQVLFNLAVNARDALVSGGTITIQATNRPGSGGRPDQVVLTVSDTGTGIPEDVRAHMFEPFFTTKAQGMGTGLGLSTVHAIVTQAGGSVQVQSALGQGSTFEVLLPRCDAPPAVVGAQPGDATSGGNEHVLVVEDDPSVRGMVVTVLSRAGYQVSMAADGKLARKVLEDVHVPVDLVLTDVVLPNEDGRAVAHVARARRSGVKVLFTSGYPADRLTADGVLPGEMDFMPKPYTPSVLLARVRAALDVAAHP